MKSIKAHENVQQIIRCVMVSDVTWYDAAIRENCSACRFDRKVITIGFQLPESEGRILPFISQTRSIGSAR